MSNSLNIDTLVEILTELRSESMKVNINPSEENLRAIMRKYDMLFVGKKFSTIYSMELCHALKNHFNIETDNHTLNLLIPLACKYLSMELEPMVKVSNIGKDTVDCYQIILW